VRSTFWDDLHRFIPIDARSRPPSLIFFSLDRFAMRAMMLTFLLAAATTLCSCASRTDLAVQRIDSAVRAYGEAYPRKMYPRTLKELTAFAAARGKPLDLTPFSKITFERSSHTSMSITYETPKPSWSYGALVYSTLYWDSTRAI
jgi:hypothetical protein